MEIKKFKKLKNNIYELELDNGSLVKLYDDVIVKYSLLINKKIDNKLLDEITKYNTSLDAYYLSLKYISKKLRCEKEIEKYLTKLDFNKDVPEDFNWEMLKVYSEKLNGNFYCAASNDFQMGIFKELGIKFYYRYSVSSFYEVDALKE